MTKQVVVIDKEKIDEIINVLKIEAKSSWYNQGKLDATEYIDNISTTITLDDDIEKRTGVILEKCLPNKEYQNYYHEAQVVWAMQELATEQQIISEIKMRPLYNLINDLTQRLSTQRPNYSEIEIKEFAEWCSVNGWYFCSKDNKWRKYGGFEYLKTTELIDKFNNR